MALDVNSYCLYLFLIIFYPYLLEFHLRHSEDGADSVIFILSLSFSHYTLSLSYIRSVFIIRIRFIPDYLQIIEAKF